jgi:1-phosphofructokinase family hexose kinase
VFLTFTPNPALDKTLFIDRNIEFDTIRARRSVDLAGGKGLNVSRALTRLGAATLAVFPAGGCPGRQVAELAEAEGLPALPVPVAGQTRTALTIQDDAGTYWHYLEPGPHLSPEELRRLGEAVQDRLPGADGLVLSGSLPHPDGGPLLRELVLAGKEREVPVALDSFGTAQLPALQAGPWLAKPTASEWRLTTGFAADTEDEQWRALAQMEAWGVILAVLSLGAQGAVARWEGRRYRVAPPQVRQVNEYGGGDSMVAGICWARARGYKIPECLVWGAACGAANAEVWDPAGIDQARVEQLSAQVRVDLVS